MLNKLIKWYIMEKKEISDEDKNAKNNTEWIVIDKPFSTELYNTKYDKSIIINNRFNDSKTKAFIEFLIDRLV